MHAVQDSQIQARSRGKGGIEFRLTGPHPDYAGLDSRGKAEPWVQRSLFSPKEESRRGQVLGIDIDGDEVLSAPN